MNNDAIILSDAVCRNAEVGLNEAVTLSLLPGEQLAVVGENGAGKNLLIDMLTGKSRLSAGSLSASVGRMRQVAFRDSYGGADTHYYYQQRWNHTEQDDVPTVAEQLGKVRDEALLTELLELFNLQPLLSKKIILLSSGELRKFQLMKALLDKPQVLIIDNPFIGLDANARQLLLQILSKLTDSSRVQLVLVLSRLDDIPPFITHVVTVKSRVVGGKQTRGEYLADLQIAHPDYATLRQRILALPDVNESWTGDEAIRLNNVCIRYGERTILNQLDWVVKRGEKWALTGANGSGKSTLLSLICADNPQGYAQDISLFGRKRGTGESIWEIKKRIGYVSPEMHRAYQKNLPAIEIVASGLHDSIGLYKRPRPEQMGICLWWMEVMGVAHLHTRPFLTLSSGEQRLCLLARAFVKDPQLLVLDEPLHGLDTYNRRRVREIIESFACRSDKTLIMVTHYEEELPTCIDHHLRLQKHES